MIIGVTTLPTHTLYRSTTLPTTGSASRAGYWLMDCNSEIKYSLLLDWPAASRIKLGGELALLASREMNTQTHYFWIRIILMVVFLSQWLVYNSPWELISLVVFKSSQWLIILTMELKWLLYILEFISVFRYRLHTVINRCRHATHVYTLTINYTTCSMLVMTCWYLV